MKTTTSRILQFRDNSHEFHEKLLAYFNKQGFLVFQVSEKSKQSYIATLCSNNTCTVENRYTFIDLYVNLCH